MSQTAIDAKLEAEFAAVAASSGCELVHVELKPGKLRVFLDRPQGVTIEDCQTVSKQLSALLDVSEFSSRPYLLEVSSPGLDRELFGPKDFARFCGRLVRVTFRAGKQRAKKTIVGKLDEFRADGGGEISIIQSESGKRYEIALGDVEKARLEIDLTAT